MANTIGILDASIGGCFNGVGDVVVFDNLTDASLATAKTSGFLGGLSLGDLLQDSTKWTGSEPTMESLKNEKGDIIYSYAENGENSFETTIMELNKAVTSKFLVGVSIGTDASLGATTWCTTTGEFIGIGDTVASIIAPVAWFNRDKNIVVVFPKARITSVLVDQAGGIGLKCSFVAQKISTTNLKTLMIGSAITANYTA